MSKKRESERRKVNAFPAGLVRAFKVLFCDGSLLKKVLAGSLSQKYLVTRSTSHGASSKFIFLEYTLENIDLLSPIFWEYTLEDIDLLSAVHFTDGKTEAPKQLTPTNLARKQRWSLQPWSARWLPSGLSLHCHQFFLSGHLPPDMTGTGWETAGGPSH